MLTIDYVAGFMDGDGSFQITDRGPKRRYEATIIAVNTCQGIIHALKYTLDLWGIDSNLHAPRKSKSRHKQAFVLTVCKAKSVMALCEILKDHLKIKQLHATLIYEYINLRLREGERGRTHFARETEIYDIMKRLNKRGI